MARKKGAVSTLVGEYDIELMNENELRMYVEALLEEHKRMRKARNVYQKDNSELLNFLNFVQEDIIQNKKVIMQNNLEFQEELLEQGTRLKYEEELLKVMGIENISQTEKYNLESHINITSTIMRNKEGEYELLKDIREKDREIEHLEYIHKLISTQSEENYSGEYEDISKNINHAFEALATEYNKIFLENCETFSKDKETELQVIWEDIPIEGFQDEIANMTTYFEDIFLKNRKALEKLRGVLTEAKKYLNNIISNLRHVKKENCELSQDSYLISPRASLISDPSFSPQKLSKLEKLTYENYLLSLKLEMLQKEHLDLKRQFASAVRRIHETADFKAYLIENELSALQNDDRRFI